MMQKTPAVVGNFFAELAKARGGNAALDRWTAALQAEFKDLADLEYRARDVVDRMALAIQAALLVQHAPAAVADAFCASRLQGGAGTASTARCRAAWTARRSSSAPRPGARPAEPPLAHHPRRCSDSHVCSRRRGLALATLKA